MPMATGGNIEVHIRNTQHAAATHANVDLPGQRAAGLDSPLRLAHLVRPFPARDSEVTIRFAVDTGGRVIDAKILQATANLGDEGMIQNTLAALLQWRFEPPTSGGKPTGYCCLEVTFENISGL
jgi:TonB family protein